MNTGSYYENQASRVVRSAGLSIIERNFRCKLGEIDLVCSEEETLVFIEVRYRSNTRFASAVASVTTNKQRRLLRAAQYYLQFHGLGERQACRFDVLAFGAGEPGTKDTLQWIKNAFTL